ncbi:MAG: hypothetical protein E7561_05695 [Ruminococcaceae bacterium]|nr:hypothetical protein [Oscillospiraceae bacterium]
MKRKLLILAIVFIGFLVCFSVSAVTTNWFDVENKNIFDLIKSSFDRTESDVIVTVNGEKIYRQTVEILLKGKEISAKSLENTEYYEGPIDKEVAIEEIINESIRDIVVRQEAEKKGLKADYETAKKDAIEAYNMVKEENAENYQFLLEYMKVMDYSEEEYLEIVVDGYINMYTRANHYDWFVEGKTGTYDQLVEEYEEYVQTLIEKANIVYK